MISRSPREAPGKRDMERFRALVDKELKDGFNVGYEVAEAFKLYRRKTRQTSPPKRDGLIAYVIEWTGETFGKDIESDLKRLKDNTGVAADRAWAIFYAMRFFSDPIVNDEDTDTLSESELFTETLERKLIRPVFRDGKKRERCYREIDGSKSLTHPERLRAKDDKVEFEASGRLPPRYFRPNFDDSYQTGRQEFLGVREELLRPRQTTIALVVAIAGPGGYGKTAIAEELATDEKIQAAFPGGIYWLQHGLHFGADEKRVKSYISTNETVKAMLSAQYADLDLRDRNFGTPELLFDAMPDDRFLIIADDVWIARQCDFIEHLPERASVLISTRAVDIAKKANCLFRVEELSEDASLELLTYGMGELSNQQRHTLRLLRDRFRGWPLLLKLANGHFRWLQDEGGSVDDAIAEYRSFFKRGNIAGWDVREPGVGDNTFARRELARLCIETGLTAILHTDVERRLFTALAVFSDKTDISLNIIEQFWDELQCDEKPNDQVPPSALWRRAQNYNLFRQYSQNNRNLRLHDEMLAHLRGSIDKEDLRQLNAKLVRAFFRMCGGRWHKLPEEELYPWRFLLWHIRNGGNQEEADRLSLDVDWLWKCLSLLGSSGLQESLRAERLSEEVEKVIQVIALAGGLLDAEPVGLLHELYGRLVHHQSVHLQRLANSALSHEQCWPRPRRPHLKPLGAELARFEGHKAAVNHAVFDNTEKHVLTASDDHTACRWRTHEGILANRFVGHRDAVLSISSNEAGNRIATASADLTARIWCANTEEQIQCLEGHSAPVTGAILDELGRKALTTSEDYTTRLWCVESGDEVLSVAGKCTSLSADVFSKHSLRFATVYGDTAFVWSLDSSEVIELKGHEDQVESAVLSHDGEFVLTSSWDGTARTWSARTGMELVRTKSKPTGMTLDLTCALFAPGQWKILTSSISHANEFWSLADNKRLSGDDGVIVASHGSLLFDKNCEYALTVLNRSSLYLHDLRHGRFRKCVGRHSRPINSVTFDQSGENILSASADGSAKLWSKQSALEAASDHSERFRIWNVAFHPKGNLIAAGCSDRVVRIFGAADICERLCIGRPQSSFREAGVLDVEFSKCGKSLLVASSDGLVRILSIPNGWEQKSFPKQGASVTSARFDPQNERIVLACSDGRMKIYSVNTGAELTKCRPSTGPALCAVFSSDGSQIVSAHRSGVVQVRQSKDLKVLRTFKGHDAWVETAVFSGSEDWILSASGDGTARLWSTTTGEEVRRFSGHDAEVRSAVFDLSEKFVLTASEDRTVRLWSTDTGRELRRVRFDDPVKVIASTSKSFFVGCGNEALYAFDLL